MTQEIRHDFTKSGADTSPVNGAFVPTARSGLDLRLWLDADDAATLTLTGSVVDEWRCKATNKLATAASGKRPTQGPRALNGVSLITFDGVDEWLQVSDPSASEQDWLFFVGNIAAGNNTDVAFAVLGSGGVNDQWVLRTTSSNSNTGLATSSYTVGQHDRENLRGNDLVLAVNAGYASSRNKAFRVDGADAADGVVQGGLWATTIPTPGYMIGAQAQDNRNCEMEVAEILVVRNPTALQVQELEGYLADKYGLTLDPSHLYDVTPPTTPNSIGNGLNGVLPASPTFDRARYINGGDQLRLPNGDAFTTGWQFTTETTAAILAAIDLLDLTATGDVFGQHDGTDGIKVEALGDGEYRLVVQGTNGVAFKAKNLATFAVVYDTGTTTLYVNGVQVDEITGTTVTWPSQNVEIGGGTLDLSVSHFRAFSDTLTVPAITTFAIAPTLPSLDPSGWWPMDEAAAATTLADASGQAADLVCGGTAAMSSTQAKFGSTSLRIPGGDAANIAEVDAPSLDIVSGLLGTVEFWLYLDGPAFSPVEGLFLLGDDGSVLNEVNLTAWVDNTGRIYAELRGFDNAFSNASSNAGAITAATWHHVAITLEGSTVSVFVDRVFLDSTSSSGIDVDNVIPTTKLRIGISKTLTNSQNMTGYIQDFLVLPYVRYRGDTGAVPTLSGHAFEAAVAAPRVKMLKPPIRWNRWRDPIIGWHPGLVAGEYDEPDRRFAAPVWQSPHFRRRNRWGLLDQRDGPNTELLLDQTGGTRHFTLPDNERDGRIFGTTVDVDGLPLSRRVRIIDRISGRTVAETWSDAAGNYEVVGLNVDRVYQVVGMDYTGEYNAVIADKAQPERRF